MKKFVLALAAVSSVLFGFGLVAQAQYGSGSEAVSFEPTSPAPGTTVTITITDCTPGEVLTVAINGTTVGTATCVAAGNLNAGSVVGLLLPRQVSTGQATLQFVAPSAPGTYTVTVTGTQGYSRTITLVVAAETAPPAGGLPATGSGGLDTTTGIALGFVVVGLGLFVVAQVRRRQQASPV